MLNKVQFRTLAQLKQSTELQAKYADKYADKLKTKAQEQGTTVDKLYQKLQQEKLEKLRQWKEKDEKTLAEVTQLQMRRPTENKQLGDIIDLEKIRDLKAPEITEIWNKYHSGKRMISGCISVDFYQQFIARLTEYPLFLLPLPKGDGFEFIVMQYMQNCLLFTSLEKYKKQDLDPLFNVTHFAMPEKGIVLMRGQGAMALNEAQTLLSLAQLFYVSGSEKQKNLVQVFNRTPDKFDFNELVASMQAF